MSKLRIKYKRLKRELDVLKNQKVPIEHIRCDHREVIKVCSERTVKLDEFEYIPEERILSLLATDLMKEVRKYVRFEKHTDYTSDGVRIRAVIDVLSDKKN